MSTCEDGRCVVRLFLGHPAVVLQWSHLVASATETFPSNLTSTPPRLYPGWSAVSYFRHLRLPS
eukprot:3341713-Amphidinium_carterae.1